ncbi:RAC-gamma serine/threonine-protein kinase [Cichlidogyrus casuarinus]|uniref:RAC-gamma serine/threonine-protein kinase n=1 Tax=Cichlidogyrus casuarinus TaxID=1844966 RepID=A0ABD2PM61_9PLAT
MDPEDDQMDTSDQAESSNFTPMQFSNISDSDLEATTMYYRWMQSNPQANMLVNDIVLQLRGSSSEPSTSTSHLLDLFHAILCQNPVPNIPSEETGEPPVIESLPLTPTVVKEGWLQKRGEYIQNWRDRYFVLREDGTFHGYKSDKHAKKNLTPLNNFTVKDCDIWTLDSPKPFMFLMRGLQLTTVVQRLFCLKSADERSSWIQAIKCVADNLKRSTANTTIIKTGSSIDLSQLSAPSVKPSAKYQLNDFELIKLLGRGTFGKVVLCRERRTGHIHAMKILRKSVLIEKDELRHTVTESRVLQMCRHPFMTELKYALKNNDYFCFVMEYVNGGELFDHLTREKRFDEPRTRFYTAEIVLALGYLHSHNIIYR